MDTSQERVNAAIVVHKEALIQTMIMVMVAVIMVVVMICVQAGLSIVLMITVKDTGKMMINQKLM